MRHRDDRSSYSIDKAPYAECIEGRLAMADGIRLLFSMDTYPRALLQVVPWITKHGCLRAGKFARVPWPPITVRLLELFYIEVI